MKMRTNETVIGRPKILFFNGKYEVAALCRDEDGNLCNRMLAVYETLDEIPDEHLN